MISGTGLAIANTIGFSAICLKSGPSDFSGGVGVAAKDVPEINPMELRRVSKENLGTWARQLRDWGFTDVSPEHLKLPN